jgi:ketosteroid isomerase-like protein
VSRENVEIFKRGVEAYNRLLDADAMLEELDPEVEWHLAAQTAFGGEATVSRGHEGVRELLRDLDDVLAEIHAEFSEIRDLGDQIVAIGRIRTRGKASGAETEAPLGAVADLSKGRLTRIRTYLDPKEGLETVGLREYPMASFANRFAKPSPSVARITERSAGARPRTRRSR